MFSAESVRLVTNLAVLLSMTMYLPDGDRGAADGNGKSAWEGYVISDRNGAEPRCWVASNCEER